MAKASSQPPSAAPNRSSRDVKSSAGLTIRRRKIRRIIILAVLFFLTPLFTITMGPSSVPLKDVVGVVVSHLPFTDVEVTWPRNVDAIVWLTRVPRVIVGLAVGAILGVSGVVLQALVRNPLAEPYVLGVSAGASTGAAISIIFLGLTMSWAVGTFAFFGALAATILVLLVAGGSQSPLQLILAGLAIGFGFTAVTNLLIFSSGSPETSQAVMFWMLGSLARTKWSQVLMIVLIALVLTVVMALLGPVLDALASGDNTATSVGINPGKARLLLLVPVSAAIAAAVAASGGIGFVGLIVPHVVRSFLGHSHRYLVLGSALAAGLFLVWTDALARIIFAPAELPIGVITGLIGAPFLVILVRRQKGLL